MAMSTPRREPVDRLPRSMRIGTRSCAECRRRKVRCIFAINSQVCKECVAHCTTCVAQQPSRLGQVRVDKEQEVNGQMQQRLEDLEGMVRRICKAINFNMEFSNLAEFETSLMGSLKPIRSVSTPETRLEEDTSTSWTDDLNSREPEAANASYDQKGSFKDAPLLNLLKDAMLVQRSDVQANIDSLEFHADRHIRTCIKDLTAMIPEYHDLTLILQLTERYWPLWPVTPQITGTNSRRPETEGKSSARDFIHDSLRSGKLAAAAKSVLWLALCIQQLPRDFKHQRTNLPATPKALQDFYLRGAETLLAVDENSGGTIESLECLSLLERFYINEGKPRKAWLTVRRSMNIALLLGLHHPEDGINGLHRAIWSQIWQSDRQLSLVLGFPYSITESHPGLLKKHAGQAIEEQVMYELSIIAGRIIDRNQNSTGADYSVTVQIHHELDQCRNGMPQDWWDAIHNPAVPLQALYGQHFIKTYYYMLRKFLHLPHMLKLSVGMEFENSRIATLEASREIIRCYETLRNGNRLELIICDLMDFQVFSAAIAIVIGLLSTNSAPDVSQEAEDWDLVHHITRQLKHVSTILECSVASQAAQLLENLSMARHGTYSGPDVYEAIIPYFGKVKISQPKRAASHVGSTLPSSVEIQAPQQLSNTIQFSTNPFSSNSYIPFSPNSMADQFSEAELGVDWTSIFNAEYNYDWSQLFENTELG